MSDNTKSNQSIHAIAECIYAMNSHEDDTFPQIIAGRLSNKIDEEIVFEFDPHELPHLSELFPAIGKEGIDVIVTMNLAHDDVYEMMMAKDRDFSEDTPLNNWIAEHYAKRMASMIIEVSSEINRDGISRIQELLDGDEEKASGELRKLMGEVTGVMHQYNSAASTDETLDKFLFFDKYMEEMERSGENDVYVTADIYATYDDNVHISFALSTKEEDVTILKHVVVSVDEFLSDSFPNLVKTEFTEAINMPALDLVLDREQDGPSQ